MIIKKIALTIIVIVSTQFIVSAQRNRSALSDSCANVASGLSHFWRIDSLGINGYRLETYKRLIACKNDNISEKHLLDKLGKPNDIATINKGIMYVYHVFNGNMMPEPSFEIVTIYFIFDREKKFLDKGESVKDKWK